MNRRKFLAFSTAAVSGGGLAHADDDTKDSRSEDVATPLLSFGLVTDVQYADAEAEGERHYRESLAKLEAAAADLASESLPFTLHLGDVIDRDFSSFGRILPCFAKLGHPVHHLLGNHDFDVADGEKGKIPATLGLSGDYYGFSAAGIRFLMLDTNDLSIYKYPSGDPRAGASRARMEALAATGAANAKPWNGGVSENQLEWLRRELEQADHQGTAVILCTHHPLLPAEGHHAWNHQEVIGVIRGYRCVKACLAGHNHAGNQVIENGIPHITFKSMLHEPGVTAYAVLRVYADRLVIEGRGREASRELPLPR